MRVEKFILFSESIKTKPECIKRLDYGDRFDTVGIFTFEVDATGNNH